MICLEIIRHALPARGHRRSARTRGNDIVDIPLVEAVAELKTVPARWYDVAKAFFG